MTIEQAKDAIRCGDLVECSPEEWPELRTKLQEFAGWSIDNGQDIHATIALSEVARLNREHGVVW